MASRAGRIAGGGQGGVGQGDDAGDAFTAEIGPGELTEDGGKLGRCRIGELGFEPSPLAEADDIDAQVPVAACRDYARFLS